MKILKLIFENINSIKGKWQIDFEDEAFNNHALFAITGPTGAGKTTILDAICLALYGETPRLNISANQNELMSIGTATASSTVIFRANGKIYQASWSQRRAKQKSDGKLQNIHREISELSHSQDNKGKILEERASLVGKKIEQILGMNKMQFTRSVMLVQGEFAAFLQSDASERGQILEQITGTQIYAKISQAAFEKHKQQVNILKNLQEKLGDINILSEDEYQKLSDTLQENQQNKSKLEAELSKLSNSLKLAEEYDNLQNQVAVYKDKVNKIQQELEEFSPNQSRLNLAKKVKEYTPIYQALQEYQQACEQKNAELIILNNELKNLQENLNKNQQDYQNNQQQLAQLMAAYEQTKPMLAQARSLDKEITALQHEQASQQKILTDYQYQQTNIDDQLQQALAEQAQLTEKTQDIKQQISQLQSENLSEKLNTYNQYRSQYTTLINTLQHTHTQQLIDRKKLQENLTKLNQLRSDYQRTKQAKLGQLEQNQQTKTKIINLLKLNDKDYTDGKLRQIFTEKQEELKTSTHKLYLLEQIYQLHQQQASIQDEINQAKLEQTRLKQKEQEIANALAASKEKLKKSKELWQMSQANFDLCKQILAMKKQLEQLKQGDRCPLCGSTNHPYKSQPEHVNDLKAEVAEQQLHAHTREFEEISTLHDEQSQESNSIKIHLENNYNKLENLINRLTASTQESDKIWEKIHKQFTTKHQADKDGIERLLEQTSNEIKQTELMLNKAKMHFDELYEQNNELTKLLTNLANIQQNGETLKQDTDMLLQQTNQNHFELSNNTMPSLLQLVQQIWQFHHEHQAEKNDSTEPLQALKIHLNDITPKDLPVDIDTISPNQPLSDSINLPSKIDNYLLSKTKQYFENTYAKLNAKLVDSETLNQLLNQQKNKLSYLNAKIKTLENQLAVSKSTYDKHQLLVNSTTQNLTVLIEQRKQLLNAQNADKVDDDYQSKINNKRSEKEQILQKLHHDTANLQANQAYISSSEKTLTDLGTKLHDTKQRFAEALNQLQLTDENAFLAAKLPDAELLSLQNHSENLHNQLNQAEIFLADNTEKLSKIKQDYPHIDNLNINDIKEKLQEIQQHLAITNQQIGTLLASKELENKNRNQQQDLLLKINNQQQENSVWEKLDLLIGSADGKKYRNFVQGLTLDMVLHHANIVLGKMTDRYLLSFDGDHSKSLEILVIDKHQGDAVRSSKNLSGGESFIISLALALGLAQINSQNVQIESLFLDEGFGTLDEAALDLALNTLFELQQSGKSIGIISHVASLKERIDTQITVEKQAGGNSTLSGAGVCRL